MSTAGDQYAHNLLALDVAMFNRIASNWTLDDVIHCVHVWPETVIRFLTVNNLAVPDV